MIRRMLEEPPRGRRLVTLVLGGLVAEVAVATVGRAMGPNQLVGLHGVVGVGIAVAVGLIGGALAGAIVAVGGAVLFVVFVAYGAPPDPRLYGIPVVLLWTGLAIGAGAISMALRRAAARANATAATSRQRILHLHQAVQRLAGSGEPGEVARIAAEEGAAALNAHAAWVGIVDEEHGQLVTVAAVGVPASAASPLRTVPLDAPFVGTEVVRTGEARCFRDAEELERAFPAEDDHRAAGFEGCIVLPLSRVGRRLGVIAFHFDRPRDLTGEERDIAYALAETATQAFDRARLFDELRHTAETLQRSLLPFHLPEFPGYEIAVRYRPASDTLSVGGDWYDVVEAGQGQIGITVGDVGGKGLEAAAIMGRLRTAMRAYAIDHAAPAMVMRRLVAYHALTRADAFATVVYAAVDRRQRRLRVASVGHPAPLLVRQGRSIPLPVHVDPPLGIDAPRRFRELAVPLQAEDLIVLLSDGVIERRAHALDAGLERVAETAITHAADPVDALAERLVRCVNDADADDDRALVVVRVPTAAAMLPARSSAAAGEADGHVDGVAAAVPVRAPR
jgi:serine phosphatase RsbU (regulator of sigma subunit)